VAASQSAEEAARTVDAGPPGRFEIDYLARALTRVGMDLDLSPV
jgi:hypothetical protein